MRAGQRASGHSPTCSSPLDPATSPSRSVTIFPAPWDLAENLLLRLQRSLHLGLLGWKAKAPLQEAAPRLADSGCPNPGPADPGLLRGQGHRGKGKATGQARPWLCGPCLGSGPMWSDVHPAPTPALLRQRPRAFFILASPTVLVPAHMPTQPHMLWKENNYQHFRAKLKP